MTCNKKPSLRIFLAERCGALGITREQLAWRLRVGLDELVGIENGELWLGSFALRLLQTATEASREAVLAAVTGSFDEMLTARDGTRRLHVYDEDARALSASAVRFGCKDIPSYMRLVEESVDDLRERYGVKPGEPLPQAIFDDLEEIFSSR